MPCGKCDAMRDGRRAGPGHPGDRQGGVPQRAHRARRARAVRATDAEAELTETSAADLSLATLGELAAPSLFSSTRCVVVRGLENLPEESVDGLLDVRRRAGRRRRAGPGARRRAEGLGHAHQAAQAGRRHRVEVRGAASLGVPGLRRPPRYARHGAHHRQRRRPRARRARSARTCARSPAAADQLTNDFPGERLSADKVSPLLRRPGRGQVVRRGRRTPSRVTASRRWRSCAGPSTTARPRSWSPPRSPAAPADWLATRGPRGDCATPTWPARSGCRRGS